MSYLFIPLSVCHDYVVEYLDWSYLGGYPVCVRENFLTFISHPQIPNKLFHLCMIVYQLMKQSLSNLY